MSNRKPICTMFLLAASLQQWKIEDYNSEIYLLDVNFSDMSNLGPIFKLESRAPPN